MSAVETTSAEKNNSNASSPQKPERRKWLADAFVIVFCVTGAAFSLNLFRLDLFQSIATQNKKPMGAVTVKYNNVQRRFSDRVLWSRLTVDSPVYLGDLIRVAEYSAATLNINDGIVDINENSLIRIRASSTGEDRVVIDLNSGSLSITGSAAADSGVALNVMGKIIAPTAKATLSASAKESGITLQVNEGSAIITGEGGQSQTINAGEALILDTKGVEQATPMAVVTLPRPNARYVKTGAEPLNIRFTWNVINIDQQQPLRLEIASRSNFARIVQTAEGVGSSNAALGAGTWYWRLSYQDTVLSSGQFTVVDAALPAPLSPIQNRDYRENTPIRFEWQPIEEASYYILEVGLTPDIINPTITRQTTIASYVESNMKAGTWYWHVKPVFSSLYEGTTAFSKVSSFKVEEIVVAAPSVSNTATPEELVIFSNAEWGPYNDKSSSKASVSAAVEMIDGMEREVLTINANIASGNSKWAGASTSNMNFIQNLRNADGIRFKVLGDGKRWRVYFATSNVTDGAFHGLTISTQNGKVSNIDIPFNKLNQPEWAQRKIKFNKGNIKWVNIEKNSDTYNVGASSIKIFDFEIYQTAKNSSATSTVTSAAVPKSDSPTTSSESETATSASSILNSDAFISSTAGWGTVHDSSSMSNISIAKETIDGIERDVLTSSTTLGGGSSKWSGVTLTDDDFYNNVFMKTHGAKGTKNTSTDLNLIRKLVNAEGVRFKAVGDGKKWRIYFATTDITDGAYYGYTITTQNGKTISFDISFSKLNQPDWAQRKGRINKNNIKGITIERNAETGSTGASTIKIFDFEPY